MPHENKHVGQTRFKNFRERAGAKIDSTPVQKMDNLGEGNATLKPGSSKIFTSDREAIVWREFIPGTHIYGRFIANR